MSFTFDNQALRGRMWEGDVLYLTGNEHPVLGKLYLSTTSFTFRKPTDKQGWPFLSGDISATIGAISVADGVVALKSSKGTFRFELFPSAAKSLQEWIEKKVDAMNTVTRLSSSFLGSYEAYPHPFTEKHKSNEEDKCQLFLYLSECVPVLQNPINWGLNDVSIQIDSETTQISIGEWKYKETSDAIHIDCNICEFGFFDDSGSEFDFHYEISYLGAGLLSRYRWEANNEKLQQRFKADKHAYPQIDSKEDFVAENPFGLRGFYRIKWSLHFD